MTRLLALALLAAGAASAQELQIYFIDVEGGQSTLLVTPAGETLLIDAGWVADGSYGARPGDPMKARDASRIVAAMQDAGVNHVDYLLATHFHRDHIGGIPELAQRVPILNFIDHGSAYPLAERAMTDSGADPQDMAAYDEYVAVRARGERMQPKPGDRLPLKDIDVLVVSTDGKTLARSLPGAGEANPSCGVPALPPTDRSGQNPRSMGILVTFGSFRFLDLGDLSGQPLHDLACPADLIGAVDVYLVAHHGGADSADPGTLAAFRPRVAVVNNGTRKGGQIATLRMLRAATELDSWQLHLSDSGGDDNAPAERVANLDTTTAYWLKITASAQGAFNLVNQRTGAGKSYGARE